MVVDTLGLILAVVVHAAHIQDREGAKQVLRAVQAPELEVLWAAGGYTGQLVDWVKEQFGWELELVKRSDDQQGFVVLPHRWKVERTFGWFGRYRRLSKDYEFLPGHSVSMIHVVMIHVMLRRLSPC